MTLKHCCGHCTIRSGRVDDLDTVVNLWQQLPGLALRAEDSPAALQPLLLEGRLHLYVAERGTDIVAAVLAGDDGRRGHLYHLAVVESMRELGLGRALVETALDELAARGIRRAHVFVQIDNDDARAFWAHLGWRSRTDIAVYTHAAAEPADAD